MLVWTWLVREWPKRVREWPTLSLYKANGCRTGCHYKQLAVWGREAMLSVFWDSFLLWDLRFSFSSLSENSVILHKNLSQLQGASASWDLSGAAAEPWSALSCLCRASFSPLIFHFCLSSGSASPPLLSHFLTAVLRSDPRTLISCWCQGWKE